jgi:RNA polymerase sigma-70 factor (ECF subfamily)
VKRRAGGPPAGPGAGFEDFYRAYRDKLLIFVRQYCGPGIDAENVCQDAWVRAYLEWAKLREPHSWVFRVAINLAHQAGREARRANPSEDILAGRQVPVRWLSSAPMPGAEWGAQVSDVRAGLQRLPWQQRAAVLLDYDGWSRPEIAAALGCTTTTVRGHLHRGRAKLRRFLGELPAVPRRAPSEGLEGRTA